MRRSVMAALGAAALLAGTTMYAQGQTQTAEAGKNGANLGSLTCNVAGGTGFVFGSSKGLSCLFARPDGTAERYEGTIKRFGVDIGFTKEAQVVWLVFGLGNLAPGALAGDYAGPTAQATVGVGLGANVLVGGNNRQISLQPVSVEGSFGLNVAAGLAEVSLKAVK